MIFPLKPTAFNRPLPIPGPVLYRDMPVIPLRVSHGGVSTGGRAFIDTMADVSLFPEDTARRLQIDLTNAPMHGVTVVGGSQVVARFAEVTLEIAAPLTTCRWRAWVGFAPTGRWLVGHLGGLEFFHFTLDPANEEFILVPRDNLPSVE